ncbi:MAG: Ppx/GppA phosphatase family protein [Balneolaceae bacterium]
MSIASIDIGTNSVLLLVAEKNNGTVNVIEELLEVPRLGKGVDQEKTLHPDSQQRVLHVLKSYKKHLQKNYPSITSPIVTATSAVRDASNRDDFLSLIKKETGWEVVLLSGLMEAEITFKGALSVLGSDDSAGRSVVLDIGGGSTEIVIGNGELDDSISLDMGSVRFSERFLTSNPPTRQQRISCELEIRRLLNNVQFKKNDISKAIGVAGTVTSIAAIELGLQEYEPAKLNGYKLSVDVIDRYVHNFAQMKSSEIEEKYPLFLQNRGDVILAGLMILKEFLTWISLDHIIVSTGGIRHGILH